MLGGFFNVLFVFFGIIFIFIFFGQLLVIGLKGLIRAMTGATHKAAQKAKEVKRNLLDFKPGIAECFNYMNDREQK